MRKKYIVVKDTPEVKTGAILEEMCDNGDQDYVVVEGKYQLDARDRKLVYWRDFVEKQPDWFQEVNLLWLTAEQIKKVKKFLNLK